MLKFPLCVAIFYTISDTNNLLTTGNYHTKNPEEHQLQSPSYRNQGPGVGGGGVAAFSQLLPLRSPATMITFAATQTLTLVFFHLPLPPP